MFNPIAAYHLKQPYSFKLFILLCLTPDDFSCQIDRELSESWLIKTWLSCLILLLHAMWKKNILLCLTLVNFTCQVNKTESSAVLLINLRGCRMAKYLFFPPNAGRIYLSSTDPYTYIGVLSHNKTLPCLRREDSRGCHYLLHILAKNVRRHKWHVN